MNKKEQNRLHRVHTIIVLAALLGKSNVGCGREDVDTIARLWKGIRKHNTSPDYREAVKAGGEECLQLAASLIENEEMEGVFVDEGSHWVKSLWRVPLDEAMRYWPDAVATVAQALCECERMERDEERREEHRKLERANPDKFYVICGSEDGTLYANVCWFTDDDDSGRVKVDELMWHSSKIDASMLTEEEAEVAIAHAAEHTAAETGRGREQVFFNPRRRPVMPKRETVA